MVLVPALRLAVTVAEVQVSQLPVLGKVWAAATVVPLTMMSMGRSVVVPLAYRMVRVAGPAVSACTVICAAAPMALLVLQKPVPENPVWSESMVPSHVPLSASCRFGGGGGGVVPPGTARISRVSPGRRVAL